ncbi:26366_t:CDS:2 [Gigaspora margarita]|uniref:26366_t:CDS:1 n=1 Tax=Gigaspora margarita TaxID=4874 RepID=A0ABN7W751_GIGMA|nr:26366_t:CDS:2 [Gigaspora margarita]
MEEYQTLPLGQIGEPTELINVQKFLDSFSLELGHEEESIRCDSKLSEKLNKKQLKEIREKCSVKEYFKLSSQFFADPTMFCLLRQYHSLGDEVINHDKRSTTSISLPPDMMSRKTIKGKDKVRTSNVVSCPKSNDASKIRPEPSAMEIKFMEMAKELDNSPLASLRDVNRTRNSHMKRADLNYLSSVKFSKPNKQDEIPIFENKPDVILSVAFYNQSKTSTRTQEFLVLGSQPLTALRDAFYCLRDFYKLEPWEQPKPTTILNATNRKMSPSYFFIENVFYNDLRDPRAVDYSKNIIEWVKEKNRFRQPGLGLYRSKTMENVTFNELSIKLNQPYLFVHQGNCQHAVVFRDLRLKQAYDDPDPTVYPKAIFRGKIGRHKCRMCMQRPAITQYLPSISLKMYFLRGIQEDKLDIAK